MGGHQLDGDAQSVMMMTGATLSISKITMGSRRLSEVEAFVFVFQIDGTG